MHNPWDDISPPTDDVSAKRVDHTHPLDLFWARDHVGRYLFIYEFASEPREKYRAPELIGIKTAIVDVQSKSSTKRLVLVLGERADWELFFSLCGDLIHTTRHIEERSAAVNTILRRLSRWQEFLKRARRKLLSEDAIKGLIGELLFLKVYLVPVFGASQAVQFWQGPEDFPQDFNVNNSAIEVKCQTGTTLPTIRINSAEQLSPQLPEMYLCVFTLGRTVPDNEDAVSLPLLIDWLREKLCDEGSSHMERFNDLLLEIGYVESEEYREFSYLVVDMAMFEVREGFPRISVEDLHPGIVRLGYSIALDDCQPFRKTPDWMEGRI